MRKDLKDLIDNHDTISFDIFDTLVHRLVNKPHTVAQFVEYQLRFHDLTKTNPQLGTMFASTRHTAEITARTERDKFVGDSEITFDDIYNVLQEVLGISQSVIIELQQLELKMEQQVLYPDPEIQEAFNYAKELHKSIILCSDMYLSSEVLRNLLTHCGYDLTTIPIYVSCELKKNKHLGNLFDYVLGQHTNKIAHIGDNEYSDKIMAESKGIDVYHYDYKNEIPITFSFDPSITQSLIDGILVKLFLTKKNRSAQETIGLQAYGPLLTGFLIWLFSKIENKNYDRILFFARDGAIFHDTIKKYIKELEFLNLPPIEYVYISRASMTLPALFDLDLQKLPRMISGYTKVPIKGWLKLYGIEDANTVLNEIQSVGLGSGETLVQGSEPKMELLLQRIYPHILKATGDAQKEALAYFGKFQKEKLATIDLGGFGSLQQNFTKVMAKMNGDIIVDGYYFNLWHQAKYSRASLHDNFHAYLYEHREDFFANLPVLLQKGGNALLESIFSAPHGTTLGYFNGEPIIEDLGDAVDLSELRNAIIEFFGAMIPIFQVVPLMLIDSIDWTRPFFRMVEFPTIREVNVLGDVCQSDGAGPAAKTRIPIAKKLDETSLSDKQLYDSAELFAYWKRGFRLRNGVK